MLLSITRDLDIEFEYDVNEVVCSLQGRPLSKFVLIKWVHFIQLFLCITFLGIFVKSFLPKGRNGALINGQIQRLEKFQSVEVQVEVGVKWK